MSKQDDPTDIVPMILVFVGLLLSAWIGRGLGHRMGTTETLRKCYLSERTIEEEAREGLSEAQYNECRGILAQRGENDE